MKLKSDSIILVAVSVTAITTTSAAGALFGTVAGSSVAHAGTFSAHPRKPIQLLTFKTHSRLILAVDLGVDTEWKDTAEGFELFLKGVGLTDLGAPAGQESAWLSQLQPDLKDSRLAEVKFRETHSGLHVTGRWKFPKGDLAPANPKMERFEYREKSPSRFVVDFWPKAGPTVAEAREQGIKQLRGAQEKAQNEQLKRRLERKLASEKARADALNIQKFCERPLSEENDVFLKFLPLHRDFEFEKYFTATTPDDGYIYYEPAAPGATSEVAEDARYVRLALDLYGKGKFALVLKTLDFFQAEQPKSPYQKEMKFLRANALMKLGMKEPAFREAGVALLEEIRTQFLNTPLSTRAGIFLANQKRLSGSHVAALESYLWLINHSSESNPLHWVFHMAAAEELYALKQGDRALKEYQWVAEHAPDSKARAEGALRIGDIYLGRFQYDRALASYYQALESFKEEGAKFPAALVNRAEAFYWLGQLEKSEKAFRDFLKDFPSHPAGWRATLRLAEIQGRKEDQSARAESRKWFYQTINTYPFSPGATLARARLVQCEDHAGFDLVAAQAFFSGEAEKFESKGEVDTKNYSDFRALSRIRTLVSFQDHDSAVDVAIEEMERSSNIASRQIIATLLRDLFRNSILTMLEQGKKYEALSFYDKKGAKIPKVQKSSDSDQDFTLPPDYLLKLSLAASDLGLGSVAQKLSDEFQHYQKQAEGARGLASGVGSDDLDLRLRRAEVRFTEAKALWMRSGIKEEKKIVECLNDVIAESPFSYEREIILGLLDEKSGRTASALAHAAKAQVLSPSSAGRPEQARIDHWVATLQAQAGSTRLAAESFRRLQDLKFGKALEPSGDAAAVLGVPPLGSLEDLLMAEGDLLSRQSRWAEAAGVYGRAVEENLGGNHALYEYARTLGKADPDHEDRKKIQATLKKVAESKVDDFWKKLANRTLAGEGQSSSKTGAREGGSK